MSVVQLDPTLFADTILELIDDPRYDKVLVTGISGVDKMAIYATILESLDGTGLRYGYMINENIVIMNADDIKDYLEELTTSLIEDQGLEGDASVAYIPDAEAALSYYYEGYGDPFGAVEDESEAFNNAGGADDDTHTILSDFLQSALEDSIIVITGGYREISANCIML
jgi:hypothetical protein